MELINENYEGYNVEDREGLLQYYFEYDVRAADFFLKLNNYWYSLDDHVYWYSLDIGGHKVRLPENLHIMVADVYGEFVDWVKVGELPGRHFTTALYYSNLYADQWSIEDISIDSIDGEKKPVSLPNSKNLLPVKVGDNRMVFVSERDSYVKTKKMNFARLY